MDNGHEFLGGLHTGVRFRGALIDHVFPDVVLNHLGDKALQGATAGRGLLKDARAFLIIFNRPFDGFHLAADAAEAIEQLCLLMSDVGHDGSTSD